MATATLWITLFSMLVCAFATRTQQDLDELIFKDVIGAAEVKDEEIAVVGTMEDIAMDEYDNKRRELEGKYNNQKRMLDDWFKVSSNILKRSYRTQDEGLYPVFADAVKDPQVLFSLALNSKEIAECVANTNMYRQKHKDTPDLVWDADIARGAQEWADYLLSESLRLKERVFKHAHAAGMGENLYWGIGQRTCSSSNERWYAEIHRYSFANNGEKKGYDHHKILHFTQIVWKGTTKFGVGIAKGNFGKYWDLYKMPQYYVVARYNPKGNYDNQFENNVMPLV